MSSGNHKVMLGTHFSTVEMAELDKLEASGFDLSKLWELIQKAGPAIVPVILSVLKNMPQSQWIVLVTAIVEALLPKS